MAQNINRLLLAVTEDDLGLAEWPGSRHNPEILAMAKAIGLGFIKDDETPWCAIYVGGKLAELGIPHTGKANARSYMDWGVEIAPDNAIPGDIIVLWRGSPDGWQGHVGIFLEWSDDRSQVKIRGGNQGNKVSDIFYPANRILGFRRYNAAIAEVVRTADNRPILSAGNTRPSRWVEDLQDGLREAGYFLGSVDGLFGPRTRAAVLAFQADFGLSVDGIVGPQVWAALDDVENERPLREVTTESIRNSGSRTIASADKIEKEAKKTGWLTQLTAVFGGLWGGSATLEKTTEKLDGVETILDRSVVWLQNYWPLFILVGLLILVMNREKATRELADLVRYFRTEDAMTGANDKV